ncbi:MAG: hypothetical protein M9936_31935 [Caldilinea sp.]|nr:hypothetical protein [Caldilinea sp.]
MNLAVPFNIPLVGQADADAVRTIQFPFGVMITAVTVQPDAFTGTPTGFTVDLNVDGDATDVAALAANTAGTVVHWLSRHHQGDDEVIRVAKNTDVTLDVNLAGGTTPTVDGIVTLWFIQGTV